jgi:hypothetical protein
VNALRIAQSVQRGTELPDLIFYTYAGFSADRAGSEAGRDPGRDRRSKGAFLFLVPLRVIKPG